MQDTCLPQNYVNCIGKVKVCGCRRFRESVLYGQCLFCSSPCLPLSYFLLVRLSCSFPPEVLSRISPFRLLHSVILSSVVVLSGIVRLSSTLFFMLYYFFILQCTRTCVGVEVLQVLQVCKFAFRFFFFRFFRLFVCVFVFFFFRFCLRACEYYNVSVFFLPCPPL